MARSKKNIQDIYPLTPLQKGILFHSVDTEGEAAPYFAHSCYRLVGALDASALERAWQTVVDRHELLRSDVEWRKTREPFQIVYRETKVSMRRISLRHVPVDQVHARLSALLADDRKEAFEFGRAADARLILAEVSDEEHYLAWGHHHVTLDGWSVSNVLGEVLLIYKAYAAGKAPEGLSPVPSYRTYLDWLSRQDRALAEAHWRRVLDGYEGARALGLPSPGAWDGVHKYAERHVLLSADESSLLRARLQEWRVTGSTFFQALWGLLVRAFTGAEDTVIGLTISGRPAEVPGVEAMVGMFINTLPLRLAFPPKQPFPAWLAEVQARASELQQHGHMSLSDVAALAGARRKASLFDTIVVFENYPMRGVADGMRDVGFEVGVCRPEGPIDENVSTTERRNNFPLTLVVSPGDRFDVILSYHRDRVGDDVAEALLEGVCALARALVASRELTVMDAVVRAHALASGAASAGPVLAPEAESQRLHAVVAAPVHARVAAVAAQRPNAVAVRFEDDTVTYADLVRQARGVARFLRANGVTRGDRVALLLPRSIEFVVALLGVLEAGAAYVPLDAGAPAARLRETLSDAGIRRVLTTAAERPRIGALDAGVLLADVGEAVLAASDEEADRAVGSAPSADDVAYVIYTSGSTGKPKGTLVTHRGVDSYVRAVTERLALEDGASMAMVSTVAADLGNTCLFVALYGGRTLHMISEARAFDANAMGDYVQAHGVGVLKIVPSHLKGLLAADEPSRVLPGHALVLGGEATSWELVDAVRELGRCRVFNHYGPTETTVGIVAYELGAASPRAESATLPLGTPLANTRVELLDAKLQRVPGGAAAELYVAGDGLARGYLDRPDATADRFVPDPFSERPGARLYRTGDRVRRLADGSLEFLGRVDDQVKVRGHRVELGEVRAALVVQPGVEDALVLLRTGRSGGARLVAYVVAKEGARERAALVAAAGERLPEYMVPSDVVWLDRFPLTANGKIDRARLPEGLPAEGDGAEAAAPTSELQATLVAIWKEVLKRERVGVDDNFFQLGGDSLLGFQVVAMARKAKIKFAPPDLFDHPTVSALAGFLESRSAGAAPPNEALRLVAGARPERLPLSHAQERMWFEWRFEPASAAYNTGIAVALEGELDRASLERALHAIVARHAILRTRYVEDASGVLPVVDEAGAPLTIGAVAEGDERAFVAAELRAPFDLANGPVIRAALARTGDARHVLVIAVHHIASDGWSSRVFVEEMGRLYDAYRRGEAPSLPAPGLPYADYAVWQRKWLASGELARQLDYWTKALGDEHPVLSLPTDRPRPVVKALAGAAHRFDLDPSLVGRLRATAKAHDATLFMVLLAAFQAWLHRVSGQADVRVGVPHANRHRPEIERTLGCFINTHVLRAQVDGALPFAALLGRVKEAALGAQAHQDLPFERLVEALAPSRDLGHTPLFQVTFNHQRVDEAALTSLDGLRVTPLDRGDVTSPFDLSLETEEDGDRVRATFVYDAALFERATVERWAAHFTELLAGAVERPGDAVGRLPLLRPHERYEQLVAWNETDAAYPAVPVHARLAEQARRTPSRVAVEDDARALTYAELEAIASALADALAAQGIGPETRVGLAVERSWRMVAAIYAVLKAGGAYVPLDPASPRERIRHAIEDAGLRLIVTDEATVAEVDGAGAPVWLVDRAIAAVEAPGRGLAEAGSAPARPEDASLEGLAYGIYTSGSTGVPKAVGVSHRALANFVASMAERPGLTADDAVLGLTPLTFDIAGLEIFLPLSVGARVVIAGRELARDPSALLRFVARHGVGVVQATPSTWRMLALAPEFASLDLRLALCGGETLPAELAERLTARLGAVWNVYGPTETTIWSTLSELRAGDRPVVGRPLANTSVYVLNASMEPCGPGVVGEICIGGHGLARGYLGRPELTAERFVPDPYARIDGGGARLYRTGDLGAFLADGTLVHVGRADHQVKIRGHRIELGEIEVALRRSPRVADAVVVARADGQGGDRLVAYVVPADAAQPRDPDAQERLRAELAARLPEAMVPAAFVLLDALPLSANGKVDRKRLPEPDAGFARRAYEAPRTPTEATIATVWAEVLGAETIGRHDHFFALGGHSLLAAQVASRLARAVGRDVPVRALFEAPTLAAFAARVDAQAEDAPSLEVTPPLVRGARGPESPLSHAQRRMWFLWRLRPESGAYNIAAALRLVGALRFDALRDAFSHLVAQHEILRTRFVEREGAAFAVVDDPRDADVTLVDLTASGDAEARARTLAEAEAVAPFDLARGPNLRVKVLALGPTEHVLLVTMHHIVSDGGSMNLLLAQFRERYASFARGDAPPAIDASAPQYADFAAWQGARLTGETLARQLAHWTSHLGSEHPVLALPADRPRPPLPTYVGDKVDLVVGPELTSRLRALAEARSASLFMVLLAAFQAWLHRASGQRHVRVGVPHANRHRVELESIVGPLVNTHVLAAEIDAGEPFAALLARTVDAALGAQAHPDLPFEHLVDALAPERTLSHNPLFQAWYNHTHQEREGAVNRRADDALAIQPFQRAKPTTQFDLALDVEEGEGGLVASLTYGTDRFDRATIERWAESFQTLLAAVARAPEERVGRLPMFDGARRAALLASGEVPRTAYPEITTLVELFEEQALATPDAVAVEDASRALTYAELNALANRLARRLKAMGVGPEVLVGLAVDRSWRMVVGLLGILKAGGAYVPLDPGYPRARMEYVVGDVRRALAEGADLVVVTEAAHLEALPARGVRGVCLDRDASQWEGESAEDLPTGALPEDLAYCIYTSGSTGEPKAVGVPHRALTNFLWSMRARPGLSAADTVLALTALTFDIAALEIYLPLIVGGRIVVADRELARDPEALLRFVAARGVTVVQATPSSWRLLAAAPGFDALRLRRALCGGEALDAELGARLIGRLGAVWNVYGPTETTVWSARRELTAKDGEPTLGEPLANTSLRVLDGDLEPVDFGVVGELYIGGDGVTRGYVNRADRTAERFVPDPFDASLGARLYRTGDLVKRRADGALVYVGRADHQVKIRGHRIELGEIEAALAHLAAPPGPRLLREAAVLAREDAPGERRLVAYVVPADAALLDGQKEGAERLRDALRSELGARLPEAMVPALFVLLPALPRSTSGKIDRKALPAPDASAAQAEYVAPRTATEATLARIWAEVLRVPQVGARDHFFASGGDSIMVLQVVGKAKQAGVAMEPRDLFRHQTLEALAAALDAPARDAEAPAKTSAARRIGLDDLASAGLHVEGAEDVYPLTPMQHGLMMHSLLGQRGSGLYHMQNVYRVGTPIDEAAFARAWAHVVRRNPILRSSFHLSDALGGLQVVHRFEDFAPVAWDLRDRLLDEQSRAVEAVLADERAAGFDLSVPDSFRVHLFRMGDASSVFVVSHHHMLMDAWCNALVLKEFLVCYQACLEDREPEPPTAPPYRAYVEWLETRDREEARAFWRAELEGVTAATPLPFVRVSEGDLLANDRVGDAFASLSEGETAALAAAAKSAGVTVNVLLQAAWALVLARHAATDDVVFGVTVAGRPMEIDGVESILGLFIQSLPLRVRVDDDATVAAWLEALFERNAKIRHYEYLPLTEIRQATRFEGNSLFYSLFVLENAPVDDDVARESVVVKGEIAGNRTHTNYPLTVVVYPGRSLGLHLSYNGDLFQVAEVEVLLGQFKSAVVSLGDAGAHATKVRDLAMGGAAPEPAPAPAARVSSTPWEGYVERFERNAKANPDRVVARCGAESRTYAELDRRASAIARALSDEGVRVDDRVALLAERGLPLLEMMIGTLKAGAAFLPLDAAHPPARIAEIVARARPRTVVTTREARAALDAARFVDPAAGIPSVVTLESIPRAGRADAARPATVPGQLAYAIYTSGSTGAPKGVLVEMRGMLQNQLSKVPYLNLGPGDVIAQTASPSFDIAVWQFLLAPLTGAVVDVVPDTIAADPEALFAYVAERGITVLESVPSLLRAALAGRVPPAEALALRWMLPTGEALPADVAARWFQVYPGVPLVNAYGPAECSDDVSLWTLTEAAAPSPRLRDEVVPIGAPVDGFAIHVVSDALRAAPTGVTGELCVSGVGVGRGYVDDPALTADRFVPDPFAAEPGARMYRTGDLGRRRPDGVFEFVGRKDHQVKIRGFRIELGEIEARLQKLEAVREAVVVAHVDRQGEQRLVAYVVPADPALARAETGERGDGGDAQTAREGFRAALRAKLPDYMVPRLYVFLDRMPLSKNGKIDRKALPRPEWEAREETYVPPRTELEIELAELWREILGVSRVGLRDRFFELGGHSLLATSVTSRVIRKYAVELPLRVLFDANELGEFAARVAEAVARRGGATDAPPLEPTSREGALPLSYGQQRLWFLWKLDPESAAYNIVVPVRLTGRLDPGALASAFVDLAARHESLRTRFEEEGGEPRAVVDADARVALTQEDLRDVPEGERLQAVHARIDREATMPFDLRAGGLLRTTLLRLAEEEHVLVLSMHHIVSDAWSIGVVVADVGRAYAARVAGGEAPPAPLAVQYADYAAWQRRWLDSETLRRQRDYWVAQLGKEHPPLRLPTDRPRPPVKSPRGASHAFAIEPKLFARSKALAKEIHATSFVVLLAAWQLLMHRYSGQREVRVGVPHANRNRPELEPMVGFFVNTHVLRARIDPRDRLRDVVLAAKETVFGAQAHQDFPFEQLVAELNPERSLAYSPLFQVSYDHQVARADARALPGGLAVEPMRRQRLTTPFDLTLVTEESEDGRLSGVIEYATDLFDGPTIARMVGHFERVLEAMAEDADAPVASFTLLTSAERAAVTSWNTREYDRLSLPQRDIAVHAFIRHRAQVRPDAVAVVCEGRSLTYQELERLSNRLAHHLVERGVRPETPVGVCLPRSVDLIVAMLGVLKSGGAYVPLDPAYPAERLARMIEDSGLTLLLASRATSVAAGDGVVRVDLDGEDAAWRAAPDDAPVIRLHPASLAYVVYTSGSTGAPKGVAVPHGSLTTHGQAIAVAYGLTSEDRALHFASMSFDAAVEQWLAPLMQGATLILTGPELWGADRMVAEIEAHRVTWFEMPPAYLVEVARWANEHGRTLRVRLCTVGGEALSREALAEIREAVGDAPIVNAYGPAETVVTPLVWRAGPKTECRTHYAPIGRAVGERTAYVLDAALQVAPVGVIGELYIGGAGIGRGYFGRADATAERFVPDPFGAPGGRLYRTGDRARWGADGVVEFLGRVDHQVKIRGHRVELGDVEAQLAAHPAVRAAVVLAREEAAGTGGRALVAYVTWAVDEAAAPTTAELRAHLRARLPEPLVPSHVIPVAAFPRTPNGKVDRRALPAPASSAAPGGAAPDTSVEVALAAIWSELLGVAGIGVDDNFFELGGDSIVSIRMVSRARERGVGLTPRSVFEHQTIRELARAATPLEAPRADVTPAAGPVPLTPIQAAFFAEAMDSRDHWNQSVLLDVRGAMDADALERALRALIAHHDALRMRFTPPAEPAEGVGTWGQAYGDAPEAPLLWVRDVASPGAITAIAEEAQRSLRLAQGEVFRGVYVRVADGTSRLLLVTHHLVVDGVSWRVLLEDLERAYAAVVEGRAPSLPAKTSSFLAWAQRLASLAGDPSLAASAEYWSAIAARGAPELPRDDASLAFDTVAHVASVSMELDAARTARLTRAGVSAHRANVDELLLAALARAVRAWSEASSVLVELETHGRDEGASGVDTTRTVGFFTHRFPVHLEVGGSEDDDVRATVARVREARRHALAYGIAVPLRVASRPAVERAEPRITFNYLGRFDGVVSEHGPFTVAGESAGAEVASDTPIGNWIDVNGEILGGVLRLTWAYSARMYRRETIERLVTAFEAELARLCEHAAARRGASGARPSDFEHVKLSADELEALLKSTGDSLRNVQDIVPLSPTQQGIVFHSALAGERPGVGHTPAADPYVNQLRVTAYGLDEARFLEAWTRAVERHEILRTSVVWGAGQDEPLQVVHRRVIPAIESVDGRAWEDPAARLDALGALELARGFDLTQAPLTRVVLVRTGEATHTVFWTTHHVILDGWSTASLMAEIVERCRDEGRRRWWPRAGRYRDYIAWLAGRDRGESEAFWRDRAGRVDEPTLLAPAASAASVGPTPREVHASGFGAIRRALGAAEMARIERFARSERVTLNTVLQGAWALVLSRYTGKDTVVFGTTVAERPASLPDAESTLGLFIDTLPVIHTIAPERGVGAWLRALQGENLAMREHASVPLYAIQSWAGHAGASLFDTLLVFENYPVSRALRTEASSPLRFGPVQVRETNNYPFTLTADVSEGLDLSASFDRARFEDALAERLLAQVERALLRLTDAADVPVGRVSLAGDASLLPARLAIGADAPEGRDGCPWIERFEEHARARPDATAVVFGDQRLTYAELDARANQLAWHLRDLGVAADGLVGVHAERSLGLVVTLLGIQKAGAGYVPLEPEQPAQRLAEMIREGGLSVIVTQDHVRAELPAGDATVVFSMDSGWEPVSHRERTPPPRALTGESAAYCIYTSGSTGTPKGVVNTHRGLANRLAWMQAEYGLSASDVVLQKTPMGFDVSVWEFFWPLMVGATLVVLPPGAHKDPRALGDAIRRRSVTTLHFVPSMLDAFLESGELPACVGLRRVLASGEALKRETVEAFRAASRAELHNLYGPTEASIDVTSFRCDRALTRASIPIGRAIWNTTMRVLDRAGHEAPEGALGELFIAGVGLARGYVHRPDLTAERFVPDPFGDGARMYRTGDLGFWTEDGQLEYAGRVDHQVKVRGMRIELGEIESALRAHRSVGAAAVVLARQGDDARLVGYVVRRPDIASLDVAKSAEEAGPGPGGDAAHEYREELRAHLRARLPEHMVPRDLVLLDALPRTPSGKLDRKALPAPESSGAGRRRTAPRTELEVRVADVWREVLGVASVDLEDGFFQLGGHSLTALRATHRLRALLGVDVGVHHLFETNSLSELVKAIEALSGGTEDGARGGGALDVARELSRALEEVEDLSASELAALLEDNS